ncbi:MAG TPA: hypothetical protein VE995_04260 [Gaiellaceae bacterium]|nr:hypothetical protein [Gaiellaceae bacterium]
MPFLPKRFGPIWSVPMQGAIVSRSCFSATCTTGAARSTSQVVKMIFAPSATSLFAHVVETVRSSPCVLQVLITSLWPRTPPFLLIWATRICAAASAGVSKGCIGPLPS